MPRHQKIAFGEMTRIGRLPDHGPITAITNAATRSQCIPPYGPITCGCPTWKSVSSALSAVTAAPMSGRCLNRHTWAPDDERASEAGAAAKKDPPFATDPSPGRSPQGNRFACLAVCCSPHRLCKTPPLPAGADLLLVKLKPPKGHNRSTACQNGRPIVSEAMVPCKNVVLSLVRLNRRDLETSGRSISADTDRAQIVVLFTLRSQNIDSGGNAVIVAIAQTS
jgi:hypothetical protein